ncbi:hypothetical protein D3C81_1929020 [compost metagenome]
MRRTNAVFHFHGLQHHQCRTGFHHLPRLDQYPHDTAVHGRAQAALMAMAGLGFGNRVEGLNGVHLAIPVQVQRAVAANRQMLAAHTCLIVHQLLAH